MKKINSIKISSVYSTILIIVFYLLPLLFKGGIAFLFLINPLTVLICSIVFGKDNKLYFILPIISALLFLPSIFIFYNESAWIYGLFYAIISLIGSFIGNKLNK